jgi:hypothetical protein
MYPAISPAVHSFARRGYGGSISDPRPAVPDGRDLPDQRLVRDNSRAVVPEHLGLDADGRLTVTPELAVLLGLEGDSIDLNHDLTPVFSSPVETMPVTAAAINHNIPSSSYRYLTMPIVELLEEVLQRTIGEGPDDPAPIENPGVPPESRRLGDMAFALRLTPGREHDALVLRNAGLALYSFCFDYRTLFGEMRARRPDLVPVMAPWIAGIARAAILRAVEVPLGADGEPQYDPRLYDPIVAPVRQPLESYFPELEWRLGQAQQQAFIAQSKQFFASVSAPVVDGVSRKHRVLGAADNELIGPRVSAFLGGTIVFRCTEAELSEYLQMIPAGKVWRSDFIGAHRSIGTLVVHPPYTAIYPNRASGTTIHDVRWQDPAGATRQVIVANRQNVHSFSLDAGYHWHPTGGPTSDAIDDLRADPWRQLLADRWHAYQIAQLVNWNGAGGR